VVARPEGDILGDSASDYLTRRILKDQADVFGDGGHAVLGKIGLAVSDAAAQLPAAEHRHDPGERFQ